MLLSMRASSSHRPASVSSSRKVSYPSTSSAARLCRISIFIVTVFFLFQSSSNASVAADNDVDYDKAQDKNDDNVQANKQTTRMITTEELAK